MVILWSSPLVSSVVFTSSPLVSSVVLENNKLEGQVFDEGLFLGEDDEFGKTTLETSGEDVKLHSKRVEKMWNYTQNEWRRCKTTLETSGEDVKLHSKRVEKM